MTQDGNEQLLTVREVAAMLRVDEATVRRWIESGVLDAVTLPHASRRKIRRVRAATIEALMHPAKD